MNILITGFSGFIGSHTADHLLRGGHQIVGCDSLTYAANLREFEKFKNLIPVYRVDICDFEKMVEIISSHNIDTIINFAAETHVDNSIKDVSPFLHSNIRGVISLLEAARDTDARLVHISTDEVYGPAKNGISFREEDALSPKNPYSASKAAADLMIQSFKNTYGIKSGIIRPCNNFGPGQHDEKFIPTIIRSLRNGNKVPVYGDGKQTREWMFVKDTARVISSIVESKEDFDIINISTQNEIKNIDVIKIICKSMNCSIDNSVNYVTDRPGHDVRYSICVDRMKSFFKESFTSFEDAIGLTIG